MNQIDFLLIFGQFEDQEIEEGTTLIFRKKVSESDSTLYSIRLQAAVHALKAIQDVSITYNGNKVNKCFSPSLIEHEEPYHLGNAQFNLTARLNSNFSGFYINQVRMSSIPEDYLDGLPKVLLNVITENKLQFSIFLPEVQQVMNRNQLNLDENVETSIKQALLMTTIKFSLKKYFGR